MSINRLVWGFIAFSLPGFIFLGQNQVLGQVQDFESNFEIKNHPDKFLPGWSANEVRNTSARVFQAIGEGIDQSNALGVQAISTFNGLIYIDLSIFNLDNPKIGFFAKTRKNGSGTRPVSVYLSYAGNNQEDFEFRTQIGNAAAFSNEDSEYRFFELEIPEVLHGKENLTLKIEVLYGSGTGSAARFFIDNFALYSGQFPADVIKIKTAKLLNPFEVELKLNKPIHIPDLHSVRIGGEMPASILSPTDTTLVIVSSDLLDDENLMLFIEKIEAKQGGISGQLAYEIPNKTIKLGNAEIIQEDSIRLSFSQLYDPAQASQTSIFQINGKVPKLLSLLENQYQIDLELDSGLPLMEQYSVNVSGIQNSKGMESQDLREFWYYDHFLEDIFVKDAKTLFLIHTLDVDIGSIDPAEIRFEDQDFQFKAVAMPNEPETISLTLNKELEENVNYRLTVPDRKSQRGYWIPGSNWNVVWDKTPPDLVNVTALSTQELLLIFSEPLDPAFAMMVQNYSLSGAEPEKATPQDNANQVVLTMKENLVVGERYVLEIMQLSDLSGNFIIPVQFSFVLVDPDEVPFKNVVINEVMAAPRAGNSLPNVEYIELLNTGEKTVSLGGWSLYNSRSSTTLPAEMLNPGEYALLVPRTQIHQFIPYGKVLGLTNWPSLLNAGDQIKLLNRNGNVVDSLVYDSNSYGSTSFAQGGYSLEIINPFFPCNLTSNLKPSISPSRGTPGKVNSIFDDTPDRTAPKLEQARILNDSSVSLVFSKIITTHIEPVRFTINPDLPIKKVILGNIPTEIHLVFEKNIMEGVRFEIQVENLRDCNGNLISIDHKNAFFTIPSPALMGDIVINELLFNPMTGSPKFVEIYNASAKFINLKDWKLANLDVSGQLANRRSITNEDYVLEPFSFLVLTTDVEKLLSDYPKGEVSRFKELPSLPSYPITSGNVALLNPDEKITEIFSYNEKMHHVLLKEKRGVSLERLSASTPIEKPSNWHSASATAGFATPGYKNSQNFENGGEYGVQIQPKIFVPDAAGEQNFTTISYKMEHSGKLGTVRIYGLDGLLIQEIVQNEIWGNTGFYTWDGTNQNGKKVRAGYYVVWVEIFDLQGNVDQIKKTVVVGTKF